MQTEKFSAKFPRRRGQQCSCLFVYVSAAKAARDVLETLFLLSAVGKQHIFILGTCWESAGAAGGVGAPFRASSLK